jgi:hypothetical protein
MGEGYPKLANATQPALYAGATKNVVDGDEEQCKTLTNAFFLLLL